LEYVHDGTLQDAIKSFNVYGYGFCSGHAANMSALALHIGFKARGWALNGHSVSEVYYDNAWHLLDPSLINYFPKPEGGLASVEEIIDAVKDWYVDHPELQTDSDALYKFSRNFGWKKGPALLANSPFYSQNGWLPGRTHGWYSTMTEYGGAPDKKPPFEYEYGYSQGYQVNIQLRRGEMLTRNWSNKGLHVNMDLKESHSPGCLKMDKGNNLTYSLKRGDLAPGRVGSGEVRYTVPLTSGEFRLGALRADNLACTSDDGTAPALHVKNPAAKGVLEIRMPSSYVYLTGAIEIEAVVPEGGEVAVFYSDNHGLDWRTVDYLMESGTRRLDFSDLALRRYDYRLRFVIKGPGAGINALTVLNDVQLSQRALPALDTGTNRISFSSGAQEGTITIEGALNTAVKSKQLIYTDFRPKVNDLEDAHLAVKGYSGDITFPIETPGDMTRLRFCTHYRARHHMDAWDLEVSFDGETFSKIDCLSGPVVGHTRTSKFIDIPPGTRKALIRYSGVQTNTTCLMGLRIDADYKEPNGSFAPVKVIYNWLENGEARQHIHIARTPDESYVIECNDKPLMKSIVMELAE
jgi:hypothetical protein